MGRRLGPLAADHPLVRDAEKCPGCHVPFVADDYVVLVTIGPGDDLIAREQRDYGQPHNVVGLPVHWECSEQYDA